jgi:tryptophan synthase beta chain
MDEALKCRTSGEKKVIVFNASGHGHFDMGSYERYLNNNLEDYEYPDELVKEAQKTLPVVPE